MVIKLSLLFEVLEECAVDDNLAIRTSDNPFPRRRTCLSKCLQTAQLMQEASAVGIDTNAGPFRGCDRLTLLEHDMIDPQLLEDVRGKQASNPGPHDNYPEWRILCCPRHFERFEADVNFEQPSSALGSILVPVSGWLHIHAIWLYHIPTPVYEL